MTLPELQNKLDEWFPGQFIAESAGQELTRVRKRGPAKDFEDEDVVGSYDLRDGDSLSPDMIKDDCDQFMREHRF